MATIKSYTDLEQSKKLADILPLESADMVWANDNDVIVVPYDLATRENVLHDFYPCWSLAALLGVLPDNKDILVALSKGGWDTETEPMTYCDEWFVDYENEDSDTYISTSSDNAVDACYEMILKLHELKML